MNLQNDIELENTRRKLRDLEQWYADASARPDENEHVRRASRASLMRLINQLKEEITRYESRQLAGRQ